MQREQTLPALVYLMGPSGAGKDAVLGYARARRPRGVHFAHRYITRPANGSGEAHVPLSPEEFQERLDAGLFALSWRAHGMGYGIGLEIDGLLERGFTVVVSGSRAALALAERRYPRLLALEITARPEILCQRLTERGREQGSALSRRLRRGQEQTPSGRGPVCILDNSGPLQEAGEQLLACLFRSRRKDAAGCREKA